MCQILFLISNYNILSHVLGLYYNLQYYSRIPTMLLIQIK